MLPFHKLFLNSTNKPDAYIIVGQCILATLPINNGNYVHLIQNRETSTTYLFDSSKKFLAENANFQIHQNMPIEHSLNCPCEKMLFLDNLCFENHKTAIKLASVGLIIDSKRRILITKRSSKLNSFPSAWVFPGGKLDFGESFEMALKREIREEVGLRLDINIPEQSTNEIQIVENTIDLNSQNPFLLWESVYPISLSSGYPQYQSLVLFYKLEMKVNCEVLNVKTGKGEISEAIWVSLDDLKQAILNPNSENIYEVYEVQGVQKSVNLSGIIEMYPNFIGEGLAEGNLRALKRLLEL